MKIEELFAGQWVYATYKETEIENGQKLRVPEMISSIYKNLDIVFVGNEPYFAMSINPVPLSREVLFFMNCVEYDDNVFFTEEGIEVTKTDEWRLETGEIIHYAHELQYYIKHNKLPYHE